MRGFLATSCILIGTLLAGGCATKKFVRNTTAPIQAKVDQVGEQTTKNGQAIEQTKTEVKQVDEKAQSGINAAKERAGTAENKANDAMSKATQANELADRNGRDLGTLKQSLQQFVSNIDDYKMQADLTIPFRFNAYALTAADKEKLDSLVASVGQYKRYFIAVEGFTDKIGPRSYNEELSRKRADAVVEYLVAKHDIPIYRIHMVGLGEEKPVDAGRTRAARAKNRRVEVRVFTADQALATMTQLK